MHYQGGKRFCRLLLVILSSAGLWASGFFVASAISPGDIVIKRVQITGGTGKTDNDFVTIYNKSSSAIDLNGLRLVKRTKTGTSDTTLKSWTSPFLLNSDASYTWANSSNSFAASINADASSTQTISNDNSVAIRQGIENTGQVIDAVGWGAAENALVEGTPFSQNPGPNEILERIDYQDTNNNSADFHIYSPYSSAICGNSSVQAPETCDDGNTTAGDGCNETCRLENTPLSTALPIVVINEFVADPIAGDSEWIELYSSSTNSISLAGWTIEDGAGTKTNLSGSIGGSLLFKIIDKPSGSLNNAGDIIIMRDAAGVIIDQVAYGNWDDGNTVDNAPTAEDPFSIARNTDGMDTNSDGMDFSVTSTPTKGMSNLITSPVNQDEGDEYDYSRDIVISEISPNPIGIDDAHSDGEFIELYNRSNRYVRLGGWRIEIGDKQYIYEFPPEAVLENKHYLIVRSTGRFQLDNAGATIKLFQPLRQTSYQTVTYKETEEGQSWILLKEQETLVNKIWKWTSLPTPAAANIRSSKPIAAFSFAEAMGINQPVLFDSSDTDLGGESATYQWTFGDGAINTLPYPEHAFAASGSFTVVLTVTNRYGSSTTSKKITIPKIENAESEQKIALTAEQSIAAHFKLTALFPNPEGADSGKEWIKIKNLGNDEASLKGWRVGNKSKKGPIISDDIILQPGAIVQLSAFLPPLGNTNDTITLFDPSGNEVDHVSYEKTLENQAYSFTDNGWRWPDIQTASKNTAKKSTASKARQVLSGLVVALPNTFSSQYFFFLPDGSAIVYQVYNSKKLFPELKLNARITVAGELSEVTAGVRLKIASPTDIQILGEEDPLEVPLSSSADLRQAPYPRLAKISGEITSKKSPHLIVTDDQGDTDVYFAKGSKLSVTTYALGDKLTVTGITEKSGDSIRLMPRSESDIGFLNAPTGPTATATADMIENSVASYPRDNKKKSLLYILLAAVGFGGTLTYFIWKYRKKLS